jgi:hypothetical protein
MPTYRFEFRENERNPPIIVDLADIETARAEAKKVTRQTMFDGLAEGADPTAWATRVYDASGYLIATITFADLVGPPTDQDQNTEVPSSGLVARSG